MPAMRSGSRAPRPPYLAYALLACLLLVSLIFHGRNAFDRFEGERYGTEFAFIPFDIDLPSMRIGDPRDPSLKPGDTIIGIQGRPVVSAADLLGPIRRAHSGDALGLELRSAPPESAIRHVTVILPPLESDPPVLVDWVSFAVGAVALPLLCIALGFWVAAVRVRDPRAWLVLLVLLSLSMFVGDDRRMWGRGDWFEPIAAIYQPLFANLWPSAMMLFGLYFPNRLAFDRRFPWAKWVVLVPILIRLIPSNLFVDVQMLYDVAAATRAEQLLAPTRVIAVPMHLVAFVTFCVCMAYRTATATTPDARRRLLLLDAGAIVGIGPAFVVILCAMAGLFEPPEWLIALLVATMFLFPAAMAYVIVVDRAMDVRVVVRQGLRYLLATGTLRALQVVLIGAVVVTAASLSASADLTTARRIGLIAVGLVAVGLIRRFAGRLRARIDRRFFREAYDTERILTDLAGRVRTMVESGPLLQTVVQRIAETLHVTRVAVLLNADGRLQPAYAIGVPHAPDVNFREDGAVAMYLKHESYARVHPERVESWPSGADPEERHSLTLLQPELLLALPSNNKVMGLMSLGPKQSEEPYSRGDIRLLEALAAQTGLALENSRLTAAIAAEIADREKAKRELEIAREVQQRLFPQEYPPIPGLEYAGSCRPALGVGGDYYDFISLPDSHLGIAIGDVSGKGVPAALLMATLRAYLRGQTVRGNSDLAAMMAHLNTLVYESSAANRYATFFYGQFEPGTRVFRYVNGGHNPPIVLRGDGETLVRLDTGGPAVGLLPSCTYAQGQVTLAPGDVLVAFTDGISEAMDATDTDWGEERLIEAIQSNRDLGPQDLITRIVCAADAFVAGAPQHDDMTVVAVRSV
jgi:phosphoserine phosphatase RsbU/P